MIFFNQTIFGRNVKKARERIYMSREEAAARLYRDEGYIYRIETGKQLPKVPDLPEIARVLGTTTDSFFEGTREVIYDD